MSLDTSLPKLADDLYDECADTLTACAREAGIRIVYPSIRVCISRDVRLATAVAKDLEEASAANRQTDPVLGVFYIEGRIGGELKGPGFYSVRVQRDGNERRAVLFNAKGQDVAKVPLIITCASEPVAVAATNFCCSVPEVGEGFICTGFTCCNEIGGCISHEACFAI